LGVPNKNVWAPVPGGVIADGKPKISRAPGTKAHGPSVDENHDDAKFVFTGIQKMARKQRGLRTTPQMSKKLRIVLHSLVQITSEDPASTQFGGKVMDSRTLQLK